MDDFDALLDQAQLPQRLVPICLRGDLAAQVQELEQQLEKAKQPAGSASLAGDGSRAIAQQIEAVREQMAAASATFRLSALSRRQFDEFIVEHPARAEDRMDMVAGYNRETMGPALIRRCLEHPKLTDAQWERLSDVLTPGEWARLDKAASELNFKEISVPFSSAASKILRNSDSA